MFATPRNFLVSRSRLLGMQDGFSLQAHRSEGDKSHSIDFASLQPQYTREVVSFDEDTYLNRLRRSF